MKKSRYLMIASVFFFIILLPCLTVRVYASQDEIRPAFMYEIISPMMIKSDLGIEWKSESHKMYSERYGVFEMKDAGFQEYRTKSFYSLGPNNSQLFRSSLHNADITPDQSYLTYEDRIIMPDVGIGFPPRGFYKMSGRSWIVPFSLPVKSIDDKESYLIPDAVSIGLEIDFFRMANDIKMFGGGGIHFPSVVGRDRTGWINPESGLLRFEWKLRGETVN